MERFMDVANQNEDGTTRGKVDPNPNQQQAVPPVIPPQYAPPAQPNPVIVNGYSSFNLANVTLPVPPKWKNNEHLLDE